MIPAFALGRTQERPLLPLAARRHWPARSASRLPGQPDGHHATELYQKRRAEHDEDLLALESPREGRFISPHDRTVQSSQLPERARDIVAGSGMAKADGWFTIFSTAWETSGLGRLRRLPGRRNPRPGSRDGAETETGHPRPHRVGESTGPPAPGALRPRGTATSSCAGAGSFRGRRSEFSSTTAKTRPGLRVAIAEELRWGRPPPAAHGESVPW